jgi:hypothetical protein
MREIHGNENSVNNVNTAIVVVAVAVVVTISSIITIIHHHYYHHRFTIIAFFCIIINNRGHHSLLGVPDPKSSDTSGVAAAAKLAADADEVRVHVILHSGS